MALKELNEQTAARVAATAVLTYDPEAAHAFLYFVPALPFRAVCSAAVSTFYTDGNHGRFTATLDYANDGVILGAEFPASGPTEALARAAIIEHELGGCPWLTTER